MLSYIINIIVWIRSYICYIILKHILGWKLKRPRKIYSLYKKRRYVIIYPYKTIYEIIISLLFIYSCKLSLNYIHTFPIKNEGIYIFLENNISEKQYSIIKNNNIDIISFSLDFNKHIVDIRDITNNITIHTLNYRDIYNKINNKIHIVNFINIDKYSEFSFINVKNTKIYSILMFLLCVYILII